MKKITNYVNQIFIGTASTEEIILQKEELIDHLTDKVNDLVKQGYNEQVAELQVIQSFGSVEAVRLEFGINSQLPKDELVMSKMLKQLYWCSYSACISAIIGIEVFWMINWLLSNQLIAKVSMIVLTTISIALVIFIQSRMVTLPKQTQNIKTVNAIYHMVMVSIIIILIGLSFSIPLLIDNSFVINTYVNDVLAYLVCSILIFLLVGYQIDCHYYKLIESFEQETSWIKKLIHSSFGQFIRQYGYIPLFTYLFLVYSSSVNRFIIIFCVALVLQIIEDIYHYHHFKLFRLYQ